MTRDLAGPGLSFRRGRWTRSWISCICRCRCHHAAGSHSRIASAVLECRYCSCPEHSPAVHEAGCRWARTHEQVDGFLYSEVKPEPPSPADLPDPDELSPKAWTS